MPVAIPLMYERTFRVRYDECDRTEAVREAEYLRYAQEAAFDASTAAGYGQAEYQAMQRIWLIRETVLDFAGWLRYGDALAVKTWVADFRRVRSRRAYEMRHGASRALIAQGYTDWAFLDSATGRPAAIPAAIIAQFFPEGPPPDGQSRDRFPAADPPAGAFTARRRVEWRDLDGARHVNNAVYLDYVEDATRQMFTALGWPAERLEAARIRLVPQHQRIEYRQQALLDEELAVMVWLSDVSAGSAIRHARITRFPDGELLTQSFTRLLGLDTAAWQPLADGIARLGLPDAGGGIASQG